MKKALPLLALFALGVGGGLVYVKNRQRATPPTTPSATRASDPGGHNLGPEGAFCGAHQITEAECPWCDKSLIESKGQCGGHGVPEALCSRCNPALIPGFKAENDWCAGHGLPESQCKRCQGGDLPPGESPRPEGGHDQGPDGSFCGKHQLAEADCPWCDASLVEKKGHCGGHGVPEAFCSRCNPALIPGFKAENDWCAGHGLPESQCKRCQSGDLPPGEREETR